MSAPPPVCLDCGVSLPPGYPSLICARCMWAGDAPGEPAAGVTAGAGAMRIPGHDVLEEIARGGMGVVYRARERETRRTVALKMLRPRLADEEGMRERFRMEASAVATLEHPSILPVYRVDEADDMPFFTMKLAAGGTLAERRESLHGRWREIAELFIQLAEAVQYAHQRGVLHRDIKPANVLFDDEGKVYLTDFGLVKLIDAVSELTGSQSFLGTPHYSSPEVASASAAAATVASDVWSLGAVLYEILTGQPPFHAEGVAPLLRRICEEPPAPFPAAAAVPRDLRVIALKCLHKDPAARYSSATAIAADLRAWLEGRPIAARPSSLLERIAGWAKRNPLPAAMAAALAVSLAVLAGLLLREYRSSQRAAREARAAETASRSAEIAAQASEAASLLEEARARLREGQWGRRNDAIASVQRAYALRPSASARDVLLSLLALPNLEPDGSVPYTASRPVFFNGDLSRYVTVESNRTAVRETGTGRVIHSVPEQANQNWPPGPLSKDGSRLFLRGARRTAVWNLESLRPGPAFPPGSGFLYFSDDSSTAATGQTISLLNVPDEPLIPAGIPEYSARGLSPDGRWLVSARADQLSMKLIETATGESVRDYEVAGSHMVHALEWSRDGRSFYTGMVDGKAARWFREVSTPDWILPAHTDSVDALTLFDRDRHLITQSRDGLTKIWDLRTLTNVLSLPWGGVRVTASTDGMRLAVDCPPEKVSRLYRFTPPPICRHVRLPASPAPNAYLQGEAAVLPGAGGGAFAVTSGYDLHFLDADGTVRKSLPCGRCDGMAPDPGGNGFIRNISQNREHSTWRCPADWAGPWNDTKLQFGKWQGGALLLAGNPVTRAVYVGIGDRIMAAEPLTREEVRMVNVTPPTLRAGGVITAIAVDPAGTLLAWAGMERAGDSRRSIHVHRLDGTGPVAALSSGAAVSVIAFTADSAALLAGDSRHVTCFELATGAVRWQIPHSRPRERDPYAPVRLSVSANTGAIAAALTPESVSLLDPLTGIEQRVFQHPLGRTVRAIGFSPDSTRLVCVGSHLVQIWDLAAAEEELKKFGMDGVP
jgi:WD40 repeat protein